MRIWDKSLWLSFMLVLTSCDEGPRRDFYKFCEDNIPDLPPEENKIIADGIEYRGDLYLFYYNAWEGYANYIEFSTDHIHGKNPPFSKQRLSRGMYRSRMYYKWGEECELFRRSLKTARARKYARHVPCQGIEKVDAFESQHIISYKEIPTFHKISQRSVKKRSYDFFERNSLTNVGEIVLYSMPIAFWLRDIPGQHDGYNCGSLRGGNFGWYLDPFVLKQDY